MDKETADAERHAKSHSAIRYLFFWSTGIVVMLFLTLLIRQRIEEIVVPFCVAGLVSLVSGIAYWRQTTAAERRADLIRKVTDPSYE